MVNNTIRIFFALALLVVKMSEEGRIWKKGLNNIFKYEAKSLTFPPETWTSVTFRANEWYRVVGKTIYEIKISFNFIISGYLRILETGVMMDNNGHIWDMTFW